MAKHIDQLPKTVIDGDHTEFVIRVRMKSRWVPHFLGLLKYMQLLGGWGGSRIVSFMSDGDGDYRPKFQWDENLPEPAEPAHSDGNGNNTYDAG